MAAEAPGAPPGTWPRLLGMAGAAGGGGPRCPQAVGLLLGALLCGGKREAQHQLIALGLRWFAAPRDGRLFSPQRR